jgi:UDPglucose--hexose-1-phosphate uridylyltransferase
MVPPLSKSKLRGGSATAGEGAMQLRKDPITNTWVLQVIGETALDDGAACPLCPGGRATGLPTIYEYPYRDPNWQVRVIPHLRPLYRIEGDPERQAEGIYDRMRNLGAHEMVIETPDHGVQLSRQSDEHVAQVLNAYVARLVDLKKDRRFRYVTVFRDQGAAAGQGLEHPHSEITALPFLPRRMTYELRTSQRYFQLKERCLVCDVIKQELSEQVRTVEWDEKFVAFCPYASRVPYETWVLPLDHNCAFEEGLTNWESQVHFARILKSVLRRLETVSDAYHLVLHTSPNTGAKFERTGNWQTLAEDYHWHVEILPVIPAKAKSYGLKEVYYNSLEPEAAARELRRVAVTL